MAKSASIFAPAQQPLSLALLVLPQCSILEVASTLDPLRAANRHLGTEAFRWRVVSPDGQAVPLTCGIELPSSGPLAMAEGADVLIVIAGYRQSEVATARLIRDLRRIAPRFAAIGGIDAGGWVLARAGLLDGRRATVHWEDLEDFAASHPQIDVVADRFVLAANRFTAGGAAPAADLMLHLIRTRHGPALALQVAASFLTTARDGAEPQIAPHAPDPRLDPRVAAAIARMEARLDSPETTAQTARALGLSARRLEQLFDAALGRSPAAHALSLRLAAARRLITDTRHPLAEIALRTGFSSAATLSRAFRNSFGTPPSALRKRP
ncbi:GlxA family transcriptional regulator [Gemmobacter fulvus]|uniref:GlxA family transcriptional regulator n=1 Tax=Gemmobacter fulvus TaxID=2840474 RepID=A0A975S2N8_9RHOB|nr:GlxA family transcriptional regulator [Gemmobacter fulvus]MBT9244453.1 GlxA family transcriptional regulator [Gemmobacter fulvus]QWK91325.1 GlxA family transcriptional regulator [Gemmobacter fulvus]